MRALFMNRSRLWLLACGTAILAGCPGKQPEEKTGPAAKPFAGIELTISVPSGLGISEELRNPLDEWSAETGATYVVREVDGWSKPGTPADSLKENRKLLTLFPLTQVGETTGLGAWQSIPESARGKNGLAWTDIFPGVRENVCAPGRSPQLVPLNLPVLICYYRGDLLQKAGLSPPQTWDDYQDLLKKLPEWAPGLTAVEPWSPDFRATMFLARAVSHAKHPGYFSFLFDIETGKPLIDTAGFVRGLEQTLAAWPLLAKDSGTLSPADCRREFLSGKAALAISLETGAGDPPLLFGPGFSAGKKPAATDKSSGGSAAASSRPEGMRIVCTPLPGTRESYNLATRSWEARGDRSLNRVGLTGFAGLMAGVSASATPMERDAALNALARLTQTDARLPFPAGTLGVCRESHADMPRAFVGSQLQEDEARRYVNAVSQSLREETQVALELPIPRRADYRAALTLGVTQALEGKAAPAAALKSVAEAWNQLLKRDGIEKVRDDYRRGIGQRPPLKSGS